LNYSPTKQLKLQMNFQFFAARHRALQISRSLARYRGQQRCGLVFVEEPQPRGTHRTDIAYFIWLQVS
jgi:hypothetical protein